LIPLVKPMMNLMIGLSRG